MSLLIRKIEKAKWLQNDITHGQDVSADAITNCTKTRANKLSVFEISEEGRITDALLAMSTGFDTPEAIDVAILPLSTVVGAGLRVEASSGGIEITELAELHRDIVDLTYKSLGIFANFIVDSIVNNRIRRFTASQIRKIAQEAVDRGRLKKSTFRESFQAKLN